ncbi:MAG: hypothetical protein A2144_06855 [Chloroflexi bacterium RBG_16_50_9]|nr:MAG: hypothetical protein A2144_06855 [Chloroflexi bacterium RBG_16_50_9]
MKKGVIIAISLALVVAFSGMGGCDNPAAGESGFNLIFKYGIMAKNELDTFKGTYTKDMVQGPSIRTDLSLSRQEMDRIYQKMVEIDFFNYPDRFSVSVPPGELISLVTPHPGYYFKVEYASRVKELWWEDDVTNQNEKADRLRELIKLIRDIVESREEYQKLPPPRGGYM